MIPSLAAGIAQLGIAGLGALNNKNNKGVNVAEAARGPLNKIPGVAGSVYNPYIQRGNEANQNLENLYGAQQSLYNNVPNPYESAPNLYANPGINFNEAPGEYAKMGSNPSAYLEDIMKTYKPSTGYQYRQKEMLDSARNAAAAGGFVGTPEDEKRRQEVVSGLLGEDMQTFLGNIFGLQGQGLAGEERRINRSQAGEQNMLLGRERDLERRYGGVERADIRHREGTERALNSRVAGEQAERNRGAAASGEMADILSGGLSQESGLNAYEAQQKNQNRAQRKKNLAEILGLAGAGAGNIYNAWKTG